MIIGFLGKGGSGKSTLSFATTKRLAERGFQVLAIDADHNMDLSYRLKAAPGQHLGSAMNDMRECLGIPSHTHYREALLADVRPWFSLSPIDVFTEKYSVAVDERIRLMSSGPHTEAVLYGDACSHSLSTPLKVYLPYLELAANQAAVVDEKAGADGAGTGIPTGFSYAFIATEPTEYGIKAAKQIADLLDFHEVPYDFVLNKALPEDTALIGLLPKPPRAIFPLEPKIGRDDAPVNQSFMQALDTLIDHARKHITENGDERLERSRRKFTKAKSR
jgi:CO dehydrogenase maturation factor